ncbi:hypothetical protein M432DRAFT_591938 [Thermoascus aurantiacus ATCC 26904]
MGKMRGAFNLRELGETLPSTNPNGSLPQVMLEGSPFGLRSQNQIDHDVKIGAAGELFIFELLLRLGLPRFGRNNWQSTIRKVVQIHHDYRDLEPWNGAKTADITYQDSDSVFTNLLIDNGYLPKDPRRSARPKLCNPVLYE